VEERKTGIDEIENLRHRVAEEEEARRKISDSSETADADMEGGHPNDSSTRGDEMEMDDGAANKDGSKTSFPAVEEKKEEATVIHADDDEAVEY